jgi:hypothetical protein
MKLNQLKESFDRAFFHLFSFKKFCVLFLSLGISALFFIVFHEIARGQPFWVQQILFFLPLFLGVVLLYGAQLFLTQSYLRECLDKPPLTFKKGLMHVLPGMIKLSYFLVPLIFFYLILLLLTGTFLLFTHLPIIGAVFKTLLAFIPFLLNLALLGIFASILFLSFYVVPLIAMDTKFLRKRLLKRMTLSPFVQFLYLLLPLLVVGVVWKFLMLAVEMSVNTYVFQESSLEVLLQSFSILIPFTALFTFPLLFLWHFAAESAHVGNES